MGMSEYIKNNYPPETIVYTNQNYPVYAYYTGMKVVRLLHEDDSFYRTYKDAMKDKGLLIAYPRIKKPSEEWLDGNPLFSKKKELDGIILYEYLPG